MEAGTVPPHKPVLTDVGADDSIVEVDVGGNYQSADVPPTVRASMDNTAAEVEPPEVRCWEIWRYQRSSLAKLAALTILVALVITVFTAFDAFHWLMVFSEWSHDNEAKGIRHTPLSAPSFVSAFIGIYILLTILLFPAALLTIVSGLLFGVLKGTLAVLVGASLGSTCAFLVGRYLLKEAVDRNITRRLVIKRSAFRFTFLLRLSPVVPFNWLNYALSVTSVPFVKYVGATVLGMVPGAVLFVYLGSTLMSVVEVKEGKVQSDDRTQILFYVGLALTAVVTVVITRLARNEIRREIALSEAEAASAERGDSSIELNAVSPSEDDRIGGLGQEDEEEEEAPETGAASIKILTVRSESVSQPTETSISTAREPEGRPGLR